MIDISDYLMQIYERPYMSVPLRTFDYDSKSIQKLLQHSFSFSCDPSYLLRFKDRGAILLLHFISPVCSKELLLSLFGFPNRDYRELVNSIRKLEISDGFLLVANLDHTFLRAHNVSCLSPKGYSFVQSKMRANLPLALTTSSNSYEPPIKTNRKKLDARKSGNLIHELCLGFTMLSFLFSPRVPFFVVGREIRILSGNKQRKNSLRIDAVIKIGLAEDKDSWKNTVFIEQDQGTETIGKLIDKFDRYYINAEQLGDIHDNFILLSFAQNEIAVEEMNIVFSMSWTNRLLEVMKFLTEKNDGDYDSILKSLLGYVQRLEFDDPIDGFEHIEALLIEFFDTGSLDEEALRRKAREFALYVSEFNSNPATERCLDSLDKLADYYNRLENHCLPAYSHAFQDICYHQAKNRSRGLIEAYMALVRAHVAGKSDYSSERSLLLFLRGFRVMMTPTFLTGNVLHFLFPREQ